MRIKKLELIGFKSFKDRTVIQFDAGITGIVGPNGCGKSNIIDALLWVMGEQSAKHLRGSSMDDVIFSGAEGYAPAGFAEVSLTLENEGGPFPAKYAQYSEVQMTRRLHKSGESEYLINREAARLRDIQEIFMDTGAGSKGFSIVEQGAIGKIITAKPEDRRTLIEEAAGITKFKVRKRESQKKLESTEQNLIRLNDIVGELRRQIESLQRQAKRAERYREIKNQMEDLDLWISSSKFLELRAIAESAEKIFTEAQTSEVESRVKLESLEAELQVKQLEVLEKEKAVENRQQVHYELQSQLQKKESEIQLLKFEVETARRNAQMQGSLRQEIEMRQGILQRDCTEISGKLEVVQQQAIEIRESFEQKNEDLITVEASIRDADDSLTIKRRELMTVQQADVQLKSQIEGMESRLADIAQRYEQAAEIFAQLNQQKVDFEERRKRVSEELEKERQMQLAIMNDVENFELNRKQVAEQLKEKQTEVETFKDELNKVTSRLYGLENLNSNFEGFEQGVKSVMLWSREQKKQVRLTADGHEVVEEVFHPVAEVVEVPSEYELAMEAALGQKLQVLVSSEEASPLEAIDHLKEKKSGRSSFISAQSASAASAMAEGFESRLKNEAGVKTLLKSVIQAPEKYRSTIEQLLGNVVVVDSIRTALQLRPNYAGLQFVTLDGDTLSADGVLTGGSQESVDSGLLRRRREIKELSLQKEELAGKLALAQGSLKKLQATLETVEADLNQAQKQKNEKEIQLAEKKKDFERAEIELRNAVNALEKQDRDVNQLQMQKTEVEEKLAQNQTRRADLESQKLTLETEVESLEVELATSRNGIDELRDEVTRLKVNLATKEQEREGLGRQNEMLQRSLDEVTTQISRVEEESSKNTQSLSLHQVQLEESKVHLEVLITQSQEAAQMMSQIRNEYEILSATVRSAESDLYTLRRSEQERLTTMNDSRLKLDQAKLNETFLMNQVMERYMRDLSQIAESYRGREGDLQQAQIDLEECRDKLKKIGEVNLSAIQEYEEISKRYEFLNQQQQDLIEAKDQLRKVIDRINRICSKRFKETFEAVNQRFEKVFPVLFGGGEAKLILIEDPEKDEMGIDIVARPPGKKPQGITLLSGGEKALTAVSLIFSIFLVKPSPFCLLDEVDAPLDDANVYRFNDLVREMAKRSQIILITHNKHTMEINEKLYGVTQQERGVSTMVSVDLKEAREVAEITM